MEIARTYNVSHSTISRELVIYLTKSTVRNADASAFCNFV
jgi:hypothetical protein